MEKVFADTDVCLDLLIERIPFYNWAAALFSKAETNRVKLYVSSLTFTFLDYHLKRKVGNLTSRQLLLRFKTFVTILEVNEKIIELALASDFNDFEDAIQYYTALEGKVKLILTRNLPDYKKAQIPVMTPENYMKSQIQ
jgi:predicted nucleic acid-binding protein